MPIDYQQVYLKIKEIGAGAQERRRTLDERRRRARQLLAAFAADLEGLRARVEAAKAADPNIRCALPVDEPLDAPYPPPDPAPAVTLIAADGSQINPDRHAAVQFGLVNVGAIVLRPNSGESTRVFTDSVLLYGEGLETEGGLLSEGMLALRRDLNERTALEELAREVDGPAVTFTDGPIELWGAKGEDPQAFAEFVERYKGVLSRLQARGVVTAGYVDKPGADLVARLLEIAAALPEELARIRDHHPLRGVSDRWLFGEAPAPLLPPGHRSAVFGLQSGSEKKYTGSLALHFFYLNVGTDGHPWPVRVEIPKWVADERGKLDLLHAALIQQCRVMGGKPYPYLLHRAHETAVVKQDEKLQVEQMLAQELRRHGQEPDQISNKAAAKGLKGRASFGGRRT
jgi:hypothetical protein